METTSYIQLYLYTRRKKVILKCYPSMLNFVVGYYFVITVCIFNTHSHYQAKIVVQKAECKYYCSKLLQQPDFFWVWLAISTKACYNIFLELHPQYVHIIQTKLSLRTSKAINYNLTTTVESQAYNSNVLDKNTKLAIVHSSASFRLVWVIKTRSIVKILIQSITLISSNYTVHTKWYRRGCCGHARVFMVN